MATETKEESVKEPRSRVARAGRKRQADAPVTPRQRGSGSGEEKPVRRRGRGGAAAPPTSAGVEPPVNDVAPEAGPESVQNAPETAREPAVVESAVAQVGPPEEEAGEVGGAGDRGAGVAAESEPGPAASPPLLVQEGVREMEFAVQPQVLKAGLAAVVAALPGKTVLPVLNSIRIATEGDGLIRLTATDLDTTVTRTVAASVSKAGAVLVPGKKLDKIASELPDGCTLDVRLKEDTVHLWCEETRTRYKLASIPVDEFPAPPEVPWETGSFPVPAATLKLLIERTAFAASTEETRPILNGVLWELGEREMAMVATNGHRLAVTRVEATGTASAEERTVTVVFSEDEGEPESRDLIIHPRALALVARLPQDGEDVRVAWSGTYAGFRGTGWEIVTRTIPGPYPHYRNVIPKDNDRVLVGDRGALTAAVRRMAIVASDQTHRIRFVLGGPMMRVAVETPDLGTADEHVPVDYEGDPLEIGFNAQYLLELLRYLPAGDVRMCFKAPERAALLSPVADNEGISTTMLLMPLRLLA